MLPTSRSTMDSAGRLVIPKAIREAAGLRPGVPLEVRLDHGHIEIEPAPLEVTISMRGGVAVAVPTHPVETVGRDDIEAVRRRLRDERENRLR